eukprot:GHVN01033719.1.p1 GENE.GHVN01033719.1~~GHVN01033719.1.p1  ORF type:complete len:264 (+),score=55.38 GHVN01033719.1:24-815(+)
MTAKMSSSISLLDAFKKGFELGGSQPHDLVMGLGVDKGVGIFGSEWGVSSITSLSDDTHTPLVTKLRRKRGMDDGEPSSVETHNDDDVTHRKASLGLPARVVDSCKTCLTLPPVIAKKRDKKSHDDDPLRGWFNLPKREHTAAVVRELTAIKLAKHADPKKFRQANLSKANLPTHFHIAREVDGMRAVNMHASESSSSMRGRNKGESTLRSLLKNHKANEWLEQRYENIQESKPQRYNSRLLSKTKQHHKSTRQINKQSRKRR